MTARMSARSVGAEMLDGMPPDHPAALRSRRDLRRVHRAMGSRTIVLRGLQALTAARQYNGAPLRVLELGAGDGSLMLGVAHGLAPRWPRVELTLLDRQPLLQRATIAAYATLGWAASQHVADVLEWATPSACSPAATRHWDLIVANLFLHHFEGAELAAVLDAVAARCDRFFACEPRRDWLALAGSHLVGAIGANAVTREDAVLSVRAGFRGEELTALWPAAQPPWPQPPQWPQWNLREYSAGLFSHCFSAARAGAD